MKCPNCGSGMRRSSKNGIVINRCSSCGLSLKGKRKDRNRKRNKYERY